MQAEDYFQFPNGLRLLSRWQAGDPRARQDLRVLFDEAIAGRHDAGFAVLAPTDRVHVSASVHMLALGILHDLYGVESADYYKTDAKRYARANLTASRLLGVNKLYTTWALYAFTCEPLGQAMMYPDKFPPGSDPDQPLIDADTWQALGTPDFDRGVPRIINDFLRETQNLTGIAPMLQISAPYSLAADIYGQEPLLADVVNAPERVNALLDHLADKVLEPWITHFLEVFPNGWIELSDASGSPFFIGPDNCKNMAIRSIRRMIDGKPWAPRVFDANYRGDFVTLAKSKSRGTRRGRGAAKPVSGIGLEQLTELKHGVCRNFVMRLEADRVPVSFYRDQAIARGVPLTTGIGSSQVDRNSVGPIDLARETTCNVAREYVDAIREVAETIDLPKDNFVTEPWPSHIYFEDVSAQSQFELIEIFVRTAQERGEFRDG